MKALAKPLVPGGPKMPGFAFMSIAGAQHNMGATRIRSYKAEWEKLLAEDGTASSAFWAGLQPYVLGWGQEVYTNCALVCVADLPNGHAATLGQKATRTNAYIEHPARLANANDAPTVAGGTDVSAAKFFFNHRGYFPVINAFWANRPAATAAAYNTQDLCLGTMERLMDLQVYAAINWANGKPYPDRNLGLAWNDNVSSNCAGAQTRPLAIRLAKALQGAYSVPTTGDACGGRPSLCDPVQPQARFTDNWKAFAFWSQHERVRCPMTGGTDVAGGPLNDNFDSGQVLDPNAASATGTLAGATVQPEEPTVDHVDRLPDPTQNVWYCWTAPDVPYCLPNVTATDNGPRAAAPAVAIWTGDTFAPGGLQLVSADYENGGIGSGIASDQSSAGFSPIAGTTYLIEVADVPGYATDPDFSVAVSTYNCF